MENGRDQKNEKIDLHFWPTTPDSREINMSEKPSMNRDIPLLPVLLNMCYVPETKKKKFSLSQHSFSLVSTLKRHDTSC